MSEPEESGAERRILGRARAMGAIHSGEMEGAYVSAEFREDADEYVRGDISIEELMRRTRRRWDSGRRRPGGDGCEWCRGCQMGAGDGPTGETWRHERLRDSTRINRWHDFYHRAGVICPSKRFATV